MSEIVMVCNMTSFTAISQIWFQVTHNNTRHVRSKFIFDFFRQWAVQFNMINIGHTFSFWSNFWWPKKRIIIIKKSWMMNTVFFNWKQKNLRSFCISVFNFDSGNNWFTCSRCDRCKAWRSSWLYCIFHNKLLSIRNEFMADAGKLANEKMC